MHDSPLIASPDDPALDRLCEQLGALSAGLDGTDHWPAEQLDLCGKSGVFRWFLPREWDGLAWSDAELIRGYLRLSAACLTTTFIITQRTGACQRIVGSGQRQLYDRWWPGLVDGQLFATVGISHLTTSRRHLAKPVLAARETDGGFC